MYTAFELIFVNYNPTDNVWMEPERLYSSQHTLAHGSFLSQVASLPSRLRSCVGATD
jgi:hypothetical protein